jgi:hypothetical protein
MQPNNINFDQIKKIIETNKLKEKINKVNDIITEEEINDPNEFIISNPLTDREILDFSRTFSEMFEFKLATYDFVFDTIGIKHHTEPINPKELSEKCTIEFFRCINKIKSLKLNILSIKRNLKAWTSRQSGVGFPTTVFYFKCQKDNYEMMIEYLNDNDWPKNPLLIMSVIYTPNNYQVLDQFHSIDLFLDLPIHEKIDYDNFLKLINSVDYDTYLETNFGHFFRLPNLLARTYPVEIQNTIIPKFKFSPNVYDFPCVGFIVKCNSQKSMIYIKIIEKNADIQYGLAICPYSKAAEGNLDAVEKETIMNYYSDADIDKVYLNIIANQEYSQGLYGYYDLLSKTYYNETQLTLYLQNNGYTYYKCSSTKDYVGSKFSLDIKFFDDYAAYQLNFNYDQSTNANCNIIITLSATEIQQFSGTYEECFSIFTQFVDLMMKL